MDLQQAYTGPHLKQLRKQYGYTQNQLAKLVGCSRPLINKSERGQHISAKTILNLHDFFTHTKKGAAIVAKKETPMKSKRRDEIFQACDNLCKNGLKLSVTRVWNELHRIGFKKGTFYTIQTAIEEFQKHGAVWSQKREEKRLKYDQEEREAQEKFARQMAERAAELEKEELEAEMKRNQDDPDSLGSKPAQEINKFRESLFKAPNIQTNIGSIIDSKTFYPGFSEMSCEDKSHTFTGNQTHDSPDSRIEVVEGLVGQLENIINLRLSSPDGKMTIEDAKSCMTNQMQVFVLKELLMEMKNKIGI